MRNLSLLQIVVFFIFISAIIVAFLIFAGALPGLRDNRFKNLTSPIEFWGVLPQQVIIPLIAEFNDKEEKNVPIHYTQFGEEEYLSRVVSALAAGKGPDIWMLPQEHFIENITKVVIIGPKSYPERTFRENFSDGSEILLWPPGRVAAIPFLSDQLVLFWNRDLFRSAGIADAPKNWAGFLTASQTLTKKNATGQITQAGSALGLFENNTHAKDIFSLFLLQIKNPITFLVSHGPQEDLRTNLRSAINESSFSTLPAIAESIRFFNQFADSRKQSYSWTRNMPDAQDAFTQGLLAMYIGYASEIAEIRNKNPHLDFDIAETPQISTESNHVTYAKLNTLVISRQSESLRQTASLILINFLTRSDIQSSIAERFFLAPTSRTALLKSHESSFLATIYTSAIKNKFWRDPDPAKTLVLLREMADQAKLETKSIESIINEAHLKMQLLLETVILP
ncbi:MAG: extracellular solute-binding protein [bacterium]|nr:extracellular solute-binding protein [bacterium]